MEQPIDQNRRYFCNEAEIFDPVSYACIALDSKRGKLIDEVWRSKEEGIDLYTGCTEGYIMNPLTGNCVKEDGELGILIKRILDAKEEEDYVGYCPEGMQFDEDTGRCVKVQSKGIRARGGIGQYTCTEYPDESSNFVPHSAQEEVAEYFVNRSKKDGLLLFWELGMGKTCATILIIDKLLAKYKNIKRVYILIPGSLRENFISQYCTFCGSSRQDLEDKFIFITTNYTNIQLPPPEEFNDSIIVIDEIQTIINGVDNRSKTFVNLYDTIMAAQRSFFVALTGTPLTKSIKDFYYLIQLLGKEFTNMQEYLSYFSQNVPNESLRPRIAPYISRVSSSTNPEDFPVTRIEFLTVPMHEGRQYDFYLKEARREKAFSGGEGPEPSELDRTLRYLKSTMFLSRRAAVMAYPIDVVTDSPNRSDSSIYEYSYPEEPDMLVEDGGWIDEKFILDELPILSPKISRVIDFIETYNYGKHVVYSEFKSRFGIELISAILKYLNIPHLLFTGDLSTDKQRAEVLDKFNSPDNKNGEKYRVLLLTEAGERGLNLLHVRWAHIMEPSIDEFKLRQVFGRFSRYKSHADLPPEQRNVTIYRYFALTPGPSIRFDGTLEGIKSIPKDRKTTDFFVYERGLNRLKTVEPMLNWLDTFPTVPQ